MSCPICAGTLPAAKRTGRPAIYCSELCRRQAEYRLRRLNSQLAEAEKKLMRARVDVVRWGSHQDALRDAWQAEVDRLSKELGELLGVSSLRTVA